MPLFVGYEDTHRMLRGCVMSYEGRLNYVAEVMPDKTCVLVDAETGDRFTVPSDLHKITNPKEGRLGYLNVKDANAHYVVRYAQRTVQMGIHNQNLRRITDGRVSSHNLGTLGRILPALQKAYRNDYPTFEEAYKLSKEIGWDVAYDRSFAITPDGCIRYQGTRVGKCEDGVEANIAWTPKGLLASFVRNRVALNWE